MTANKNNNKLLSLITLGEEIIKQSTQTPPSKYKVISNFKLTTSSNNTKLNMLT